MWCSQTLPTTTGRDRASRARGSFRDFRIWTRFIYFRVIRLDFNPWATADLCNWKSWAGLGTKLTYVQQPVANTELEVYEKSPVWLGWLMIVNFLITLANETFINMIFDEDNCIVTN